MWRQFSKRQIDNYMIEDEKKDCNYCSSLTEYLTRRVLKMVISSMPSSDQNQEIIIREKMNKKLALTSREILAPLHLKLQKRTLQDQAKNLEGVQLAPYVIQMYSTLLDPECARQLEGKQSLHGRNEDLVVKPLEKAPGELLLFFSMSTDSPHECRQAVQSLWASPHFCDENIPMVHIAQSQNDLTRVATESSSAEHKG